jgi:endo-1,4-beta-xylanase
MKTTCCLFSFLWILSPTLLAQENVQQGGFRERWVDYNTTPATGLGLVAPTMDYSGTAQIRRVAAVGQHPRIYFNSADTAEIFNRLRTTVSGKAIYANLRAYTLLLNKGNAGYNRKATYAIDAFGNPYISNVGSWDVSTVVPKLIANDPMALSFFSDRMRLSSAMSMEAFDCLMNRNKTDPDVGISFNQRAQNLAKAMTFWAKLTINDPTVTYNNGNMFGSVNMAMCYDLNYWAMTASQRDTVRQALVKIISPIPRYGPNLNAYATTSNWTALFGFDLLMNFAVEGETGYNPTFTHDYARTYHNFLTYGYLASGEGYEGTGKNYVFATTLIALAKRGYSLLGHPHLRAYATRYLNALAQPYGYGFIGTDLIGGHGTNPALGGYRFNASDAIGLKYIYPQDPSVDFLWKTYISTSVTLTSKGYVTQNIIANDGYYNYLLLAAIFGLDYDPTITANVAHKNELDYFSKQGGLGVMRSDFSEQGMMVFFHTRQNNGGHTYGNRNEFTLSALGRTWVQRVFAYEKEFAQTKFQNCILIDDKGVQVSEPTQPLRQPAKVIGWLSNQSMSSVTGDATYAYNWKWQWTGYPHNGDHPWLKLPGWSKVSQKPNEFQLFPFDTRLYPFADTSYYNQPFELRPVKIGLPRRNIQFRGNEVEKVKRTAALVRATKPYLLVIDDVKKDQNKHIYKWHANIPSDLTIDKTDVKLTDKDYRCDIILKESTGNRRLLIRVLQNEGYNGTTAVGRIEPYEYTTEDGTVFLNPPDLVRQRLVIESNSIEPKFKVLLFAYTVGDILPVTNFNTDHSKVQITTGTDTRIFTFGEAKIAENTTLLQLAKTTLSVRANLQGTMLTAPNKTGYGTVMRDNLRVKNLIPKGDPYQNRTGFIHVNNSQKDTIINPNVLTVTGNNAIVDWVFVELRNRLDPSKVVATKSGLIQRDGDVVDTDGTSPLLFNAPADNYYIVIRHRNHLGVMSKNALTFTETASTIFDFTTSQSAVSGTNAQVVLPNATKALWAGDANADNDIVSVGSQTDVNKISKQILLASLNSNFSTSYVLNGYADTDIDMNGQTATAGTAADIFLIARNVLLHPANGKFSPSYIINNTYPQGNNQAATVHLKDVTPFPIGAAIDPNLLKNNTAYRTILTDEMSSVSVENVQKWGTIHPAINTYNFVPADYIVNWAAANQKRVHGHTLLWHSYNPTWLNNFQGDSTAWENLMKTHIQTVVRHYKGKVKSWDVVNEAFTDAGAVRQTSAKAGEGSIWGQKLGPKYIERAFQYAHQADPDALLFYNDYGQEGNTQKLKAGVDMANDFKSRGIPINGLGLQFHIGVSQSEAGIVNAIKQYSATGLLVHISELDILASDWKKDPALVYTEDLQQRQADKYKFVAQTYKQLVPKAQQHGITTWNVGDADSWIPKLGYTDWPLLFDSSYIKKKTYYSFLQGLKN